MTKYIVWFLRNNLVMLASLVSQIANVKLGLRLCPASGLFKPGSLDQNLA